MEGKRENEGKHADILNWRRKEIETKLKINTN